MHALLAELGRTPGAWARRVAIAVALVAGVGAAAGGVEGYRRWDVAVRVSACEAEGATIEAVWNDDARERVRDAFAATGVSYAEATADKVMPWLDEAAAAWKQQRTDVCLNAEVRGVGGEELVDRAEWCLEDRKLALESLVTEFGRASTTTIRAAVTAAAGQTAVDECTNEGWLLSQPLPAMGVRDALGAVRAKLSQSRALALAGRYKEALEITTEAREQAIDWPPSWAEARRREAMWLGKLGEYDEAETAAKEAYFEAGRVGAWNTAASAASDLIYLVGVKKARHADGRLWAQHAELATAHAHDSKGLMAVNHRDQLAEVLADMGALAEALVLYEKVVAAREETQGLDHPDTANSLGGLAHVYIRMGEYAEARVRLERVLAIREKALGPAHPDVATSLSNLAGVYGETGAYGEALALLERALAISEEALGPEHPGTVNCAYNLAVMHHLTGAHAKALELYERALAIQEQTLGSEHPAVAAIVDNIASIYSVMGRNAEARVLHLRALSIREKTLGLEHTDVASSLSNLGLLLIDLKEYSEARAVLERALAIQEKALGPDHPAVATSIINIADIHTGLREYDRARPLYERALTIREKALGPDHPNVAQSLSSLAAMHLNTRNPRAALPLLERALPIFDASVGTQEGEPSSHFILAEVLVATAGDRVRALAEARKALDGLRELGMTGQVTEVEAWITKHESE